MATAPHRENAILRLYRSCLALYPAEFRDEYARELSLAFTDRWREERSPRVCLEGLGGILQEAPKEHLHVIFKDLRYALRVLRKDTTVTLAALAILALGIGATTLVFSLANGLLLRPLPYTDPNRIVALGEYSPKDPNQYGTIAFPNFVDYRARAQLVENVGLYGEGSAMLRGQGAAETVPATVVSDGVFRTLGVTPILGRIFTREETSHGGAQTVILSEELWRRWYASDPQIVGRSIEFGAGMRTVVGVMPAGFHFPSLAQLWLPDQTDPAKALRSDYYMSAIARLKPGVTPERAMSEMDAILQQIHRENPAVNNNYRARVNLLRTYEAQDYRKQVIALLVAVALLLAIACANVSNLLLVKASARGREMAVRMAMGATRRRLVRQLASESLLLGLAGGALGTGLAYAGLPALLALIPVDLPRWMKFSMDTRVLLFTLAVSLATSLVFGLAPAFGSSVANLTASLKEGGRGSGGGRHKLVRNALVVAEVALSVILLTGAGLTVRSFLALRAQNLGYRPEHVLSMNVDYPDKRYPDGPKAHDLIRRLTADISALPGVTSAAFTSGVPLQDGWSRTYTIEGRPRELKDMPLVNHVVVVPGYFATLGIPLIEGRDFSEADFDNQHILVVTRTFARENWPHESAIGKHVRFGPPVNNEAWNTIVGVVADNRHQQIKAGRAVVYLTYSADITPSSLLVRAVGDPAGLTSAIRSHIQAFDPDIAIDQVITLPQVIERASWQDRFLAILFLAFAVLALTLASVGLYAALSYTVSLHSREIGIRMALGASTTSVQGMLLRQGMALALTGLAIGMAGALALTRLLESQLFGISPRDPVTYSVTTLVLLVIAMLAVFVPASRAARIDPAIVLRCE
jgi:putative ABC transport system permease protein